MRAGTGASRPAMPQNDHSRVRKGSGSAGVAAAACSWRAYAARLLMDLGGAWHKVGRGRGKGGSHFFLKIAAHSGARAFPSLHTAPRCPPYPVAPASAADANIQDPSHGAMRPATTGSVPSSQSAVSASTAKPQSTGHA